MVVSVRFLSSYLSSLYNIKVDPHSDPIKGKAVVDTSINPIRPFGCSVDGLVEALWAKQDIGRVKLNTDASVAGEEA